MANKLLAKMKKEKAFVDILATEQIPDEFLSTNCIPVNLLLSGKIQGGIKKGVISQIAADSSYGKSMIGYAVLKSAQANGMDCFILDTERATNYEVLKKIGVNMDDVGVFNTNRIPEIKQILGKMMHGLSREECRNTFLLLDSWGPIIEQQVIDKAEEASSAVNMSAAKFKGEVANLLMATGFTVLVLNHVYASLQMYGDAVTVGGGKKLYFLSDGIMLATSAKKDKDKDGVLQGKIITAKAVKGRSAKENVTTHYMIKYNGGISPYYGLLDEAIESGEVFKPKPGYYCRTNYDVDPATGEPSKIWKEADLYCSEFWVPLYKNENFRHFVESKFAFEDQEIINATEDVMAMIDGKAEVSAASDISEEDISEDEE